MDKYLPTTLPVSGHHPAMDKYLPTTLDTGMHLRLVAEPAITPSRGSICHNQRSGQPTPRSQHHVVHQNRIATAQHCRSQVLPLAGHSSGKVTTTPQDTAG
jgi:hypothetical protein